MQGIGVALQCVRIGRVKGFALDIPAFSREAALKAAQGERSGTLGNSYQLGIRSEGAPEAPGQEAGVFRCPILQLLQSWTLYFIQLPSVPLRFTWAEIFNRFAV